MDMWCRIGISLENPDLHPVVLFLRVIEDGVERNGVCQHCEGLITEIDCRLHRLHLNSTP